MAAIDQGHLEVVQYLVTQRTDLNAKTEVCGCICRVIPFSYCHKNISVLWICIVIYRNLIFHSKHGRMVPLLFRLQVMRDT